MQWWGNGLSLGQINFILHGDKLYETYFDFNIFGWGRRIKDISVDEYVCMQVTNLLQNINFASVLDRQTSYAAATL